MDSSTSPRQPPSRARFRAGVICIVMNYVLGAPFLVVVESVAAVQGSGQLAIIGTVVYAFSWGLLGLGVWLAGPEVVTTVKAWFHARLGKGRRGSR